MKPKVYFQLEISIQQTRENEEFVLINRFRTYKDLLDFKEKSENRYGELVKSVIVKRINTELL